MYYYKIYVAVINEEFTVWHLRRQYVFLSLIMATYDKLI